MLKKLIAPRFLCILLSMLVFSCTFFSPADADNVGQSGRMLDLYTQKEPFSGKGLNQSSDTFSPQEQVVLYAYVTYNNECIVNKIVAFQIIGPPNPSKNITHIETDSTNASGIATTTFRIPWPDESPEICVFGIWTIIASVDIAEQVVQDRLTFKVGWTIEIISVRPIDQQLHHETQFAKGGFMGINVTLENIAMTKKNTTIIIAAEDEQQTPIYEIQIFDLVVEPGRKNITRKAKIPTWAAVGDANLTVSAYTALPTLGGIPYCPSRSIPFQITVHDLAIIQIAISSRTAYIGELIDINVTIKNEGTEIEQCNVTAYYNCSCTGTSTISEIPPKAEAILSFTWNTSMVDKGNYTIWAEVPPVPDECDIENNVFVDGTVSIRRRTPPTGRDIAVAEVHPYPTWVYENDTVNISIVVRNNGNMTETFSVDIYYNSVKIKRLSVANLPPQKNQTLIALWETSCIPTGSYIIKANATILPGETNVQNNEFVDGTVEITAAPIPLSPRIALICLIIGLVILLVTILILTILFLARKRRKDR